MTTASSAPMAKEVGRFMSDLFGLKIIANEIDASRLDEVAAVASYVDGNDVICGQIVCDLSCAAILGAALTQIPMGAVEGSIESGKLSSNLKENVSEVLNIAVNLFSSHQSARLVLKGVSFDEQAAQHTQDESDHSDDFQINVQRYGDGAVRIIHCAQV